MMVTLTVAAILAMLAAPSFADFIDRARLKGVAGNVTDFINDARAESVKRNRNVNVAFGGTTAAWCVGANGPTEPNAGDPVPTAPPSCDCNANASSCKVGSDQKTLLSTDTNGVVLSAVPGAFVFDSRMGTINPLGTTTVTMTSPRGKFDLRLTVTPLGQVTLCTPAGKPPVSEYASCP
ncbi:MAG: hypothetical protein HOQ02_08080 [Lysobacter sp.]|nr:hypothetical protein [Lysobacter sp.]